MSQEQLQRMRKAAILVASLGNREGEQLLDGLPISEAKILRLAVDELGPIDPQEREEVLQELRLGAGRPTAQEGQLPQKVAPQGFEPSGVELNWSSQVEETESSLPSEIPHRYQTYQATPSSSIGQLARPSSSTKGSLFNFIDQHSTQTVAQLLSEEPPQVLAVVLSQLTADQGADLLLELPPAKQTDALERLAHLHPVDQHSLEMLKNHLTHELDSHQQQERIRAQGSDKVCQILSHTNRLQRAELISKLNRRNIQLNQHFGETPADTPNLPCMTNQILQTENTRLPTETHSKYLADFESSPVPSKEISNNQALSHLPTKTPKAESSAPVDSANNTTIRTTDPYDLQPDGDMSSLERVSDTQLFHALKKMDSQAGLLALVGAPPQLLKRILSQLPRRQAKQFRQQLHSLQPTRIGDLLAAQQQFVQLATSPFTL